MSLESEIIIVSGLPRSGTSLMMQMLHQGGIPALTDEIRTADTDNPRGYYEFERVKRTREDASWLLDARGKAVKMVSSLLYELPPTESYRVIFMRRDLDEILASQEKMLTRLGRTAAPRDQMKQSYTIHLNRIFNWLETQAQIRLLEISYNDLMSSPASMIKTIAEFLDGSPAQSQMLSAIDRGLYRNQTESFVL